jgi:DNA-binding NarL/FixJ family response regulator
MATGTGKGVPLASVLIVDNEALVALYLSDLVEDFNFRVVGTAVTPDQAKQLAEQTSPDIALVDFSLQEKADGAALAQDLRERFGIAIIFLSGYSDIAGRPDVQRTSPIAVLQKPCPPNALKRALQDALRRIDAQGGRIRRSPHHGG